jgi:preprotein translocase subunit YajC
MAALKKREERKRASHSNGVGSSLAVSRVDPVAPPSLIERLHLPLFLWPQRFMIPRCARWIGPRDRTKSFTSGGANVGIWVRFLEVALLADAKTPPAAGGEGGGGSFVFPALIAILVLGYFMLFLPERKKQKAFRDQIAALKKNDRVVTIGGIYGVVANIHREADKVTVKVDDQTKIDFTLGAISRVISADSPAETDKPTT